MRCQCIAWLFILLITTSTRNSLCAGTSRHTNNWAVIVDTSVFWFNYRHVANALSMYRVVKSLGIPDSQIILMLAEDIPCNDRNFYKGEVFNNAKRNLELYGEDVEVDYRGSEVTVENFLRVLSGRHPAGTPASKRLDTDESSNLFIFMTGHGGDEFLKFQDSEELTSTDLADAFEHMYEKKRYKEVLFAIDTCQACTLFKQFYSPGIVAIGSSQKDENSYSHHGDHEHLGVSVIDRFTYFTLEFLERNKEKLIKDSGSLTLQDLFQYYNPVKLHSHVGWNSTLTRPLNKVPLTDFFGSFLQVKTGISPFAPDVMEPNTASLNVDVDVDVDEDYEAELFSNYIYRPTF